MLPTGPGSPASFGNHNAATNKEEVARAALRSLADPTPTIPLTTTSVAQTAAAPLHARHRSGSRPHSFADLSAHHAETHPQRQGYNPPLRSSYASSSMMELSDLRHLSNRPDPSQATQERSASYFGAYRITDSPSSSPQLNPSSTSLAFNPTSPPLNQPPSLSMSSSASNSIYDPLPSPEAHETSLRRVAANLKLGYEEIRHTVQAHYPQYYMRGLDHANGGQSHARKPYMDHHMDQDTLRLVLDAMRAEEREAQVSSFSEAYIRQDRARDKMDLRPPPPPGQIWACDRPAYERIASRERVSHSFANRRTSHETYGRQQAAAVESFRAGNAVYSTSPQSAIIEGPMSSSPRATSPSPFAFDPLRRPSLSPIQSPRRDSDDSFDSFEDARRRWPSRSGSELAQSPPSYSRPIPFSQRKGRSIDDYLEQSGRQLHRYSRPRASIPSGSLEGEIPLPNHNRHSYQPYPQVSRNNPLQLTQTQTWSPSTSPSMVDSPKYSYAQLPRRSPLISSKASISSMSNAAQAHGAAFTPSPMLGLTDRNGWGSPSIKAEASDRFWAHDSVDPPSQRGWSEDAAAEAARVKVEDMQIDDEKPRSKQAHRGSPRNPRRTFETRELSRSEIMQRLQEKVKSRIAAKERGESVDVERPTGRGKGTVSRSASAGRRGALKANTARVANVAALKAATAESSTPTADDAARLVATSTSAGFESLLRAAAVADPSKPATIA